MDHRIIQVSKTQAILLDRIENDEGENHPPWQVLVSTYPHPEHRYDEWATFADVPAAQSYIVDYSERSAAQFAERASEWAVKLVT